MADAIAEELDSIKRLMLLLLVKLGATSDEIGVVLGMHPGNVRKMIPGKKVKRIEFVQNSKTK